MICGASVHGTEEELAHTREALRAALADAPDAYWRYQAASMAWITTPITAALRDRAPLELPATLACGAFSPAVGTQESARRFQGLVPGAAVARIPASKLWWFEEGKEPCEAVAALFDEFLGRRLASISSSWPSTPFSTPL